MPLQWPVYLIQEVYIVFDQPTVVNLIEMFNGQKTDFSDWSFHLKLLLCSLCESLLQLPVYGAGGV